MASPFSVYTGSDLTTLTDSLLSIGSGIIIDPSSITLLASAQEAVNLYDGSLTPLGIGAGLLLTSGTTPGTLNSVEWFGTDNSGSSGTFQNGDADINAVVNTVFQTQSYDATTLSFAFTVADPTATSVSFDLVFGSDEYPEWVDQFVDSAIVMVNGVNHALFNHDPNHPLSVVSANLAAGYFQDNAGNALPIEYDGVSHVLKIIAPILSGGAINHIKIGIADTGDHIYDSGIFLANFSAGNIPGSGVVSPTTSGTEGDDSVTGSGKDEYFDLKGGDDVVYAGAGDDIIVAGSGNDTVYGGSGADEMKGDAGNDRLDGGDGGDTAVYAGPSTHYSVTYDGVSYTVTDIATGTEGVDTLTNVEFIRFSDGLFVLGPDGLTPAPDPGTLPSNQPGIVFLSGVGALGQTLTAQVSDANGVPATITYAWQADGLDLGVSGNTFVVGEAQVGQNISVTASYTDVAGNAESPTSASKHIAAPGNGDFAISLLNLGAPLGASVMNPLTTLLQNAINLGISPNEAGIIIKSALNIDPGVDLLHYDSWAILQVNPDDTAALAVEKTAVQVAVMTSLGSDETGMALTQAILLAHSTNSNLDLANEDVIANLLGLAPGNPLVHEIWDRNDTIGLATSVDQINTIWLDIQSGLEIVLSASIGTLSIHINQAPTGSATANLSLGTQGSDYLISATDLLQGFHDADGDTLAVSGLSADTGLVTDNGDGTFTLTPTPNFLGPVELTYSVIDGLGGSASASQLLVITPVNQATPGNDTLTGGLGSGPLMGGPGNDLYLVSAATNTIIELPGEGIDTVRAPLSWRLGPHLENLELTGTYRSSGTGNALDNTLTGNTAGNILDGGAGADTLIGGAGNDTYVVDNANDVIQEAGADAGDSVRSWVDWTLGDDLENLILLGTKPLNGTGNTLNNSLTGNGNANVLNGGGGNDVLDGGSGNDTLTGGAGGDTFAFTTPLNALRNVDTITDFSSGTDRIQLSPAIFRDMGFSGSPGADAFFHSGSAAHDASDRILYDSDTGTLAYDADGTGPLAAVQFALLSGAPTLLHNDFLVG